ncbi:MAG: MBL fold metallo-hydrolase [Candidatus Omnitrophica bacterium]|nr:MBL fold metallo-hydrolase [Candidatus Omnitrophota bacterium]
MDIKILFDKDAIDSKFKTGWGFSAFIDEVLFDTGEDGDFLLSNLKVANIDIDSIKKIVISHDHWDHTGGLWDILKIKNDLEVYGCRGFSSETKNKIKNSGAKLVEINRQMQIMPGVYTSGQVLGFYKAAQIAEQALIVKSEKGLVVITGCSHPGIVKMIESVRNNFRKEDIYLVLGGFHLMNKEKREIKLIAEKLKELKIGSVGPTHCTGYEAQQIFKETFGDKYISVKVGKVVSV